MPIVVMIVISHDPHTAVALHMIIISHDPTHDPHTAVALHMISSDHQQQPRPHLVIITSNSPQITVSDIQTHVTSASHIILIILILTL